MPKAFVWNGTDVIKYNQMTLVGESGTRDKWNRRLWTWRCDCGVTKDLIMQDVKGGHSKTCGGPAHADERAKRLSESLTKKWASGTRKLSEAQEGSQPGARYGKLTLQGPGPGETYKNGERTRSYVFMCDCGEERIARLDLIKGNLADGVVPACFRCMAQADPVYVKKVDMAERYVGKRYGRLLVTEMEPERTEDGVWKCICRCDCGNVVSVRINALGRLTNSCGCLNSDKMSEMAAVENYRHGHTLTGALNGHTPLYRAWLKIRAGCLLGQTRGFHRVCHEFDPRWEDYNNFLADFGEIKVTETISRVNSQLPWSKENCYVNLGRRPATAAKPETAKVPVKDQIKKK
jgi:hypothetical protein